MPWGVLNDLMPYEISWLLEQHMEDKKDHFETLAYSFRAGYVSAKSGKPLRLFEDKKQQKDTNLTAESKAKQLEELDNIFD